MALVESDLFGNVRDKVKRAIDIAKTFVPPEGYYLAYSGGKDSVVVKAILDMAEVKYDTHYNVTTVDPPELVRFIISQFEGVIYDMPDGTNRFFKVIDRHRLQNVGEHDLPSKVIHFSIPKYNMRQLIIKNLYPPTQLARYCCKELKESNGKYRITVTGSRRYESVNRKNNSGDVVIFDGVVGSKAALDNNVNFIQTNRGGGGVKLR